MAGIEILITLITVALTVPQLEAAGFNCSKENTDPILFVHNYNCSKYFTCDRGRIIARDCPPGLYFGYGAVRCERSERADCASLDSNIVKEIDMGLIGDRCPMECDGDILFPHKSCDKYYICVDGDEVEMNCPTGEYFNTRTDKCDSPNRAGCEFEEVNISGLITCPLESNGVILFPHQSNCGKYYTCVYGILVEQNCPSGQQFNDKTKKCDGPENAGCK